MLEKVTNDAEVKLFSPSLPKGGGTVQGIENHFNAPSSDGMAKLSVVIPVTAARYLTPSLALHYHNGVGNGSFGIGWRLTLSSIRQRTTSGIRT